MKLFVDTWGWLALADSDEPRHQEAVLRYRERARLTGRILTSNFVLDEFLTILFSRRPFVEVERFTKPLIGSALVTVEQVSEKRFESALNLRLTLTDKPRISFTDLTSMVSMQELGIIDILTADNHFAQVGLGFRLLPG